MRIVHVAESLGGGLLEFVIKITKHLPAEEHIVVFGKAIEGGWDKKLMMDQLRQKFPPNVEFHHWEGVQREISPIADIKSVWTLHRILKAIPNIDVIHLHSSKAGVVGRTLFFLTQTKLPVYYTPHGAPFLRLDLSPAKRKLVETVEATANKLSGKIVCCSKSEFDVYAKRGIQPFAYINNGTETSKTGNNFKKDASPRSGKVRVCSVGRLTFQKNPALFNEIASAFVNNPLLEFVWIGEGELRDDIQSPNIRVTGWVTLEEVKQEVLNSDIYLSTALWEGLPFAVLEAMNWGKPLLLKDSVGNVDLVKKGENGALFSDSAEAISIIQKWAEQPEKLRKMGEASSAFCHEAFDATKNFAKFQRLYKEGHILLPNN